MGKDSSTALKAALYYGTESCSKLCQIQRHTREHLKAMQSYLLALLF